MTRFFSSPSSGAARRERKTRRPQGVSRRQRKKQLGFETLEDRRVMSAQSPIPVGELELYTSDVQSFSSTTTEGQLEIMQRELLRYASQAGITTPYVAQSIPTDPLLPEQWFLINSGQQVGNPDFQDIFGVPGEDLNVAPVWNAGIFGEGVKVGVFETDGIFQTTHPDLAANVDPNLSFTTPTVPDADHATAVAGIIGAVANNGIGGTGVAPGVTLVPMGDVNAVSIPDAFRYAMDNGIDIINNSWGPGGGRSLGGPTPLDVLALRDSVLFGRPDENGNPLGVINVFASGNSASSVGVGPPALDSSSFNGWVNSRYTIGVTGVDHDGEYNNVDGTVTSYMEIGASVLVAAPTGSNALSIVDDSGIGSGIVTTDRTGEDGYNGSDNTGLPFGDRDYLEDIDYTTRFNGTSAAAPMVSGVIALMLEANPNLNWREVQDILVRSSRQNAKTATQADGLDIAEGTTPYQSTWIVNQVPLFHDPDDYVATIPNGLQILNPTLDSRQSFGNSIHYAPTPQVITNAAGFTVSQGRGTNAEQTGFAHGVVDAELAVTLAKQWNTKGQGLADELTFTTAVGRERAINLPAAELGFAGQNILGDNVNIIIPGGLYGGAGFSDYWNAYDTGGPSGTYPLRGVPEELTVPSGNDMVIETIEVSVTIGGDMTEFLDNVRMVLVSPNGTQSEFTPYAVDPSFNAANSVHQSLGVTGNGQNGVSNNIEDFMNAGSVAGLSTFTFSTNRNWGERSDDAIIFDPTTNEPFIDPFFGGGNRFNGVDASAGDLMTSGWQLYFENYSPVALTLSDFEIAWHGSPIEAATERVQGLIGIDDNLDDIFNYNRMIETIVDLDGDPIRQRLGEVVNILDPNPETMGANITVLAHRDVNGNGVLDGADLLVDQFVTGADGNYYFDLLPDDYIISISDPLDRTVVDDSLTPAGFVKDYQREWYITSDFFKVWDYDANLQVPTQDVNGVQTPGAFLDGTGSEVVNGVKGINFLLDPGPPALQQVDFSGLVYADTNGDGVFNSDDVAVPGIKVYGDVNRNGQYDSGEVIVSTDFAGQYQLTLPSTFTAVVNIGVIVPVDWIATNPSSGSENFFIQPGDSFSGVDFAIMPPTFSGGDGTSQPGYLLGVAYDDTNANGIRESTEAGMSGLRIYLDNNNTGVFDAGDVEAITNANGSFIFAYVPAGNKLLRVELAAPLEATSPSSAAYSIILSGAGTYSGLEFGVDNSAALDFGDLPVVYGVTTLPDGARHPKGSFFLGDRIDAELDGQPSVNADGDDAVGGDEDGIVFDDIIKGTTTSSFVVSASRNGGWLTGWMDFDGDGDFGGLTDGFSERLVMSKDGEPFVTRLLLQMGVNNVSFEVPATIDADTIFARFRYGEHSIDTLTGLALVGEVEDYAITPVTPPNPQIVIHGPDFNEDGAVDGFDFLSWQRGFGSASPNAADGDSDSDGDVDGNDLADWSEAYGDGVTPAPLVLQTADFNSDGTTDGGDFLTWQRGVGETVSAVFSMGDADSDGIIGGEDLAIWAQAYGTSSPAGASSGAVANYSSYSPVAVSVGTQTSGSSSRSAGVAPLAADLSVESPLSSQVELAVADSSLTARIETFGYGGRLMSLARDFQDRFESNRSPLERIRTRRSEDHRVEKHLDRSHELLNLGFALRDRALDHLFAGRRKNALEEAGVWKHQRSGEDEESAADALGTALAEQIDWRFG